MLSAHALMGGPYLEAPTRWAVANGRGLNQEALLRHACWKLLRCKGQMIRLCQFWSLGCWVLGRLVMMSADGPEDG